MHHEPLKPAPLQPAATEVNRTTDYTVASVDSHASPEATTVTVATGRLIDLIHHHQNLNQPQSFGDFAHGHYTAVVHQVNLPFSYYRSKGTTSLPRWRRGTTVHQGERLVRSQAGRSTSCAFAFHTPTTTSTRKDDKPTVCYRRQWNPCHMDFGLVPASH